MTYQPKKGDRVIFINEPGETTVPTIVHSGAYSGVVDIAHKNGQSTIIVDKRLNEDFTPRANCYIAAIRIGNDDLAPV